LLTDNPIEASHSATFFVSNIHKKALFRDTDRHEFSAKTSNVIL